LALGAYDGFFGPGTGTLLIAAYTTLFHDDLTRATANAKVANLASNLAALAYYAAASSVLWKVSLPMAAGQAVGAAVGARLAVRGGARLIRVALVVVTIAIAAKLLAGML
ncbi:MAG TPA: TSUP family transporter, partial [Minicystis sp.]|nr:TSUP family transporter [Minicystis sp.]